MTEFPFLFELNVIHILGIFLKGFRIFELSFLQANPNCPFASHKKFRHDQARRGEDMS